MNKIRPTEKEKKKKRNRKELRGVRRICVILVMLLFSGSLLSSAPVFAARGQFAEASLTTALADEGQITVRLTEAKAAMEDTAAYLYKTVDNPQVGSIGGEWAVLALARSGYEVPASYFQNYYDTVVNSVKGVKGILHEKKYTEYSRLIIALTAIGADPSNVGGYNLLTPLGDFDKTIWQGINGPVWALIALDSGGYAMPENGAAAIPATRQRYVDEILSRQLSDGGFSLTAKPTSGGADNVTADPDITGMVLQALSNYQDQAKVKKATEEALACLSAMQSETGGFSAADSDNVESCAQTLLALTALGVPLDDARFVKNGHTLLENLLSFYLKGKGFLHTAASSNNQMATEQAFQALVAIWRTQQGKSSLYSMKDVTPLVSGNGAAEGEGRSGKSDAVIKREIVKPGRTFADIAGHKNQGAIEALAERDVINGKTEDLFLPDATMTRAEFSAIMVRALGLEPKSSSRFADVPSGAWHAAYVGTAGRCGIITGTSNGLFLPDGTITKQEAAVMTARAAKLCGMNTDMDAATVRDTLAAFDDYITVANWAAPAAAFCYSADILSSEELKILPMEPIKRGEIAEMLYRMLKKADLL